LGGFKALDLKAVKCSQTLQKASKINLKSLLLRYKEQGLFSIVIFRKCGSSLSKSLRGTFLKTLSFTTPLLSLL
jgi:hypothetical protein